MLKKIIALRLSDYNTIDYFGLDIQLKIRFLSRHSLLLIILAYIGNFFFLFFYFPLSLFLKNPQVWILYCTSTLLHGYAKTFVWSKWTVSRP